MKGIEIVATGRALPKKVVTNEEISQFLDTSDAWIRSRTGIAQRYQCQEETCTSLAIEAGRRALEKSGIRAEEIGVVIAATVTGEYAFPSTACLIQRALGLSEEVMAFDLLAACSGFVYGVEVCRGLLLAGKKKYALLVGCEEFSRILDWTDRSTCVLFGDGAGAAILTLKENLYAHKAWALGEGEEKSLVCNGIGKNASYIRMEGNTVFRFAVHALKQGIEEVLEEAKISLEEVDYVICHQANARIIDHVRKKLNAREEQFYKNMENYANTSAASIPIALDEMFEKGMLKPAMKIICVGFGAGFTWSSVLITV